MSPEDEVRLTHIVDAARLVETYLEGVTNEAFLGDPLRQDAVIRRIQIIGEATRHISPETLATMPDFPAKEARGMRHILVHDYEEVNLGLVWDTAREDVPVLRRVVESHLP